MFDVQKKRLIKAHWAHICYNLQKHNKAGNTANFQAGDISRRKKVKEKRPSPFLLSESGFLRLLGLVGKNLIVHCVMSISSSHNSRLTTHQFTF